MALSRSLLAGHVFQSRASRPRKHGQQRHLLCAGDSARWRPPARRSPPPASLPASARPARPICVPHSGLWATKAEGKAPPRGLGRTREGREAGASWRQDIEAFHAHTQAERALEGRGRAGAGGPGWFILSRAAWEGESIPWGLRPSTLGVHRKDLPRKDAAKVSWEQGQEAT